MGIRTPQHLTVTGTFVVALCLLALVGLPAQAYEEGDDFEAGQVVVKLEPTSGATIEEINADYGSRTLEKLLGSAGIYLIELPADSDTEANAEEMEEDPRLLYAEPNFIADTPEGHRYRHKAAGTSASLSAQYAYDALNLSYARKVGQGGEGTTVAVLDTGVQLGHPELRANFEGVKKYDFVGDDPNPADRKVGLDADGNGLADELSGHGTHVAGIVDIAAPQARIMPLRVLNSEGYGNVFLIAEAISYAERHGADVINLSLSTPGVSEVLQDRISGATERGVVVAAAAGNVNTARPQYPAAGEGEASSTDGLLAVTSVDRYEEKSHFASYGSWVDVAAPGNAIRSAFPTDEFAHWSGTSMAAPFVAGQAALIHSQDPSLDPAATEALIQDTARSLTATNPSYAGMLGAGHANIGASLRKLQSGTGSDDD